MDNQGLKDKYDEMHKVGTTAWFSDGREERETILKMGEPWGIKIVLEIGCGEGELGKKIKSIDRFYHGIDYSEVAISKAKNIFPGENVFAVKNYRELGGNYYDRIVMQGVLEHLDNPFTELKWMIDNLLVKGGDVITSSPCFLNPRGIVWMTLDMLGAVMSKTDLHYLHPWQFEEFCYDNNYKIETKDCDLSWGNDVSMIDDLYQRIPLALRDGNLKGDWYKLLDFLSRCKVRGTGATMVYRIST